VFSGFIAVWFFAASPIRRSVSVNATYDGVVRLPWSLAIISTRSFCHTPTHEYVVPKSMPIALIVESVLFVLLLLLLFFELVKVDACSALRNKRKKKKGKREKKENS
jgi:hypothetical protein